MFSAVINKVWPTILGKFAGMNVSLMLVWDYLHSQSGFQEQKGLSIYYYFCKMVLENATIH